MSPHLEMSTRVRAAARVIWAIVAIVYLVFVPIAWLTPTVLPLIAATFVVPLSVASAVVLNRESAAFRRTLVSGSLLYGSGAVALAQAPMRLLNAPIVGAALTVLFVFLVLYPFAISGWITWHLGRDE